MTVERVADEGAALERTRMAWTRTCLGLLATSAIALRLVLQDPTALVVGVALLGAVGAVVLLLVGGRRYREAHEALRSPTGGQGVRVATAAVRTATLAVLALSALLAASAVL